MRNGMKNVGQSSDLDRLVHGHGHMMLAILRCGQVHMVCLLPGYLVADAAEAFYDLIAG